MDSPIAHEDPDFASLLEGARILVSPHEAGQCRESATAPAQGRAACYFLVPWFRSLSWSMG